MDVDERDRGRHLHEATPDEETPGVVGVDQASDRAGEEQQRDDGRDRPWRATDRGARFHVDSSTRAGAAAVGLAFLESSRAVAEEFIATEHEEPEEWLDVASLANADLWLTVNETRKVTSALAAVLEPYRNRSLADRPTAAVACGSSLRTGGTDREYPLEGRVAFGAAVRRPRISHSTTPHSPE
jgi:hypothetical protein